MRFLFALFVFILACVGIYKFPARSPQVLIQESAGGSASPWERNPIAGVKVSLVTPKGTTVSYTNGTGHADLCAKNSRNPGHLILEKDGYLRCKIRYPGKISLREELEPRPADSVPETASSYSQTPGPSARQWRSRPGLGPRASFDVEWAPDF